MPKDFLCRLAVLEGGGTFRPAECGLNRPAAIGPYRLYQDRWWPRGQDPQEIVFQVSSAPGLPAVWTGCILIGLGLFYAFYLKPLLLRRRTAP
jgi:hypothetical protein